MKEIDKLVEVEAQGQKSTALPAKRGVHVHILAALACLLIALMVWICVMNTQDTDYVPLRVKNPQGGVTYEFSAEDLQVRGKVSALKNLNEIAIEVPQGLPSGIYRLTESDLGLPDGVHPAEELRLTLTVSAD